MIITLQWEGPHRLMSADGVFEPPDSAGLYMWTVAPLHGNKSSYIGMAGKSIRQRLREHVVGIVTGEYWLPNDDHLDKGLPPGWAHQSLGKGDLAYFDCDWEHIQRQALNNLRKLSFFWATLDQDRVILMSVESGLLSEARRSGAPLQNGGVSLVSEKAPRVVVTNSLPAAVTIEGLPHSFEYGKIIAGQ